MMGRGKGRGRGLRQGGAAPMREPDPETLAKIVGGKIERSKFIS